MEFCVTKDNILAVCGVPSFSLPFTTPFPPPPPSPSQWMYILVGLVLFSLMSAGQNAAQQAGSGAS